MYQYKTKDGSEVFIPGVGETVDGIITSEFELENPKLEFVGKVEKVEEEPAPAITAAPEESEAPAAAPAPSIPPTPVAPTSNEQPQAPAENESEKL